MYVLLNILLNFPLTHKYFSRNLKPTVYSAKDNEMFCNFLLHLLLVRNNHEWFVNLLQPETSLDFS